MCILQQAAVFAINLGSDLFELIVLFLMKNPINYKDQFSGMEVSNTNCRGSRIFYNLFEFGTQQKVESLSPLSS